MYQPFLVCITLIKKGGDSMYKVYVNGFFVGMEILTPAEITVLNKQGVIVMPC